MRVLYYILLISITAAGCASDNNLTIFNEEKAQLEQMKADIVSLANTSVCGDTYECKYIALGSKPCGGPWSYITYSTSINVESFEAKVQDYNEREDAFNQKWGIMSDCGAPDFPVDVVCENNTCVLKFAL